MAPSARDLLTAQVFGAVVRRKDALPFERAYAHYRLEQFEQAYNVLLPALACASPAASWDNAAYARAGAAVCASPEALRTAVLCAQAAYRVGRYAESLRLYAALAIGTRDAERFAVNAEAARAGLASATGSMRLEEEVASECVASRLFPVMEGASADDDPEVAYNRACALAASGRLRCALATLEGLQSTMTDDASLEQSVAAMRGYVLQGLGRGDEARMAYRGVDAERLAPIVAWNVAVLDADGSGEGLPAPLAQSAAAACRRGTPQHAHGRLALAVSLRASAPRASLRIILPLLEVACVRGAALTHALSLARQLGHPPGANPVLSAAADLVSVRAHTRSSRTERRRMAARYACTPYASSILSALR